MAERIWTGLGPTQADGQACVICARSFRARGSVTVPVGRSRTGSQVFACAGECTSCVGAPGGQLQMVPLEALTAAGIAFLEALERATAATPTGDPRHAYPDEVVTATVQAAAPLVVAAELRRIAAEVVDSVSEGVGQWCARYLRERAEQLDPAGGAR
jgi:hypothetical protein